MPPLSPSQDLPNRRATVLSELVRLFASGKDPMGLAEAAVELVARATGALSVFVYFWEPDTERLVLRIVTRADSHLEIEHVHMRLGEGIAGWSGLHQRPVVINENIQDDPRFLAVEGVSEDQYKSVITVPIHDEEQFYGVFAMYADRPFAFGEDELAISEEVGWLLASGLKRAENVRDLEIQSATARFLVDLPASAASSGASALKESAHRVLSLLDADMCIIDYVPWIGMGADPVIIAERPLVGEQPRIRLTHSKHAIREQHERYEMNHDRISVALGFGTSRGVLTCYRVRRFSPAEADRLHILATQIGVLLETVGNGSVGAANMVRILISRDGDEISRSLRRIGWRGTAFHPVLIQLQHAGVDNETLSREIRDSIASDLGAEVPTMGSDTRLLILAPAGSKAQSDASLEAVRIWLKKLTSKIDLSIVVGIGESTSHAQDLSIAIRQAHDALTWAQFIAPTGPVTVVEYRDIKSVMGLPALVGELAPILSTLRYHVAEVHRYDLAHGTQLLETLESYAANGGAAAETAQSLYIHRNTIRQRLARIEQILDTRLADLGDWTTIMLATRLIRAGSRG